MSEPLALFCKEQVYLIRSSGLSPPDALRRGTMLNVSHCMLSHKVVAVGFNTLMLDASVGD